ncbi:hypothetical protein LEP1GSC186_2699 [Leptospira noguchii serovar Autumnalis str. ZUN142]|uniref:Uncharacterized protein n=1 Tax=Leptospira noguchii serovar Autumnalis str. ZUN142 TaxID=1085540 RepID=M6V0T6_9LEPT|nr:hypothetical protein LEP1GSC186_2699 [Leptospira noguchii serovar Autumnalis str. ZUN142]
MYHWTYQILFLRVEILIFIFTIFWENRVLKDAGFLIRS